MNQRSSSAVYGRIERIGGRLEPGYDVPEALREERAARRREYGGTIKYPEGTAQRIEEMIARLDELNPRSEEGAAQVQEALVELEEMYRPGGSGPN